MLHTGDRRERGRSIALLGQPLRDAWMDEITEVAGEPSLLGSVVFDYTKMGRDLSILVKIPFF